MIPSPASRGGGWHRLPSVCLSGILHDRPLPFRRVPFTRLPRSEAPLNPHQGFHHHRPRVSYGWERDRRGCAGFSGGSKVKPKASKPIPVPPMSRRHDRRRCLPVPTGHRHRQTFSPSVPTHRRHDRAGRWVGRRLFPLVPTGRRHRPMALRRELVRPNSSAEAPHKDLNSAQAGDTSPPRPTALHGMLTPPLPRSPHPARPGRGDL